MDKKNSDIVLGILFGGIGILSIFAFCIFLFPYYVWATSFVALKGYNWFLIDLIGIELRQIHFAALSSIIGLLKFSPRFVVPKTEENFLGGLFGTVVHPWFVLFVLWILTFFL